jgi:MFS transporter, ACS family, pantothenate transporter
MDSIAALVEERPTAKSKMEKRLVMRLDLCIMAYCCLCYFFNYLDRAAFANAYVAGQKEDLGLIGNQYNLLISMFTAGYVIAQIPHAITLQVVAPRIWLPTTMIAWSGLTMCCAACQNFSQLAAVRFFQGAMEASLYCGTMYVMGAWYTSQEIAKRTAIFTAIGQIGSMFAGVMMAAMNNTLDGAHQLGGWQWLYLISECHSCSLLHGVD